MHSAMNTALAPRSIALSIKRVMSPKLWIPRRGSVKYLYAVNLAQPKEETLRSLYAGSLLTRRGPRCIGVVWGYGSRLHVHQQHEVKAPTAAWFETSDANPATLTCADFSPAYLPLGSAERANPSVGY